MSETTPLTPKATRWRRWFLLATALLLLYFLLPLTLNWLATCLVRQDPLQSADVVIAMGGSTPCLRPRYAVELYRQRLARKVVISGLPVEWGEAAQKETRQSLVNFGATEADIVFADDTLNTRREADALVQLMREQGWKSALIVTDPFHTRRATYTFEQAAPDLIFYAAPLPAGAGVWSPNRWWTRRGDMYYTVRELIAWGNTLAGGLR